VRLRQRDNFILSSEKSKSEALTTGRRKILDFESHDRLPPHSKGRIRRRSSCNAETFQKLWVSNPRGALFPYSRHPTTCTATDAVLSTLTGVTQSITRLRTVGTLKWGRIFLLNTVFTLSLGPTHPDFPWVTVKRQKCEVGRSS
jgi:hypothetical protein